MAHEQFFFTKNISNDIFTINEGEHRHLSRVMRKNKGDIIWISDGKGNGVSG